KTGAAYDMPSAPVDGMDVVAVHTATDEAVRRARAGEGPTFLEIRTYRYKGHSMSDPAKYRRKEDLEEYTGKDPVSAVKKAMLDNQYAGDDWFKEVEDNVKKEIAEAVKFAEESDFPDPSEIYKDVYAQEDYPFVKG